MGKTTALSNTRTYEGYFGYAISNNTLSLCKALVKKVDEQQLNKTVVNEGNFNIDGGIATGNQPYSLGALTWTSPQKPSLQITINRLNILAGDTLTFNGRTYTAVNGAKADNTEFDMSLATNNLIQTDLGDSWNNDTRPQTYGDFVYEGIGTNRYVQEDLNFIGSLMPKIPFGTTGTGIGASGVTNDVFVNRADGDVYVEADLAYVTDGLQSAFTESRLLEIELDCTSAPTTPGYMKSVLLLISKMEKLVARNGTTTYLDGTYSDIPVKDGTNPFAPTQLWTIDKADAYYYCNVQEIV